MNILIIATVVCVLVLMGMFQRWQNANMHKTYKDHPLWDDPEYRDHIASYYIDAPTMLIITLVTLVVISIVVGFIANLFS